MIVMIVFEDSHLCARVPYDNNLQSSLIPLFKLYMFVWDCIVQEFSAVVESFEMMLAAVGCSIVSPPQKQKTQSS